MKNIFLLAVSAPYIPAMVMQIKKKAAMLVFHSWVDMKNVQVSPAAKNPL